MAFPLRAMDTENKVDDNKDEDIEDTVDDTAVAVCTHKKDVVV